MFKQSATKLLELNEEKVKEWLESFDAVITDCDGNYELKHFRNGNLISL